MISRDFIKRQLEELGRILGKVITDMLKLKEQGKVNEGLVLAKDSLKSLFDLDIEKVLSIIPADNIVETLIKEKKINSGKLSYVGDLLYTTAELFEKNKETEKANNLYQKVLTIFNYVDLTEKTFSLDRNNKIETIQFVKGILNKKNEK